MRHHKELLNGSLLYDSRINMRNKKLNYRFIQISSVIVVILKCEKHSGLVLLVVEATASVRMENNIPQLSLYSLLFMLPVILERALI